MANKRFGRGGKGGKNCPPLSSAMKKQQRKERSQRAPVSRLKKNSRHIERSKEAMEALKRQQEAERKYRTKMNGPAEEDAVSESEAEEDERENDFELLVKTLNNGRKGAGKREEAIESGGESESETESESEIEADEGEEQETEEVEEQDVDMDSEEESKDGSDSEIEEVEEEHPDEDPYMVHINYNISPQMLESLSAKPVVVQKSTVKYKKMGQLMVEIPRDSGQNKDEAVLLTDDEKYASEGTIPKALDPHELDVKTLYLKERIQRHLSEPVFSELQAEFFSILNNYQDLYYPMRTLNNGEEIRFAYCLHALNHILKSTSKILHHNAKLAEANKKSAKRKKRRGKKTKAAELEYRDQGLVRPKILIVAPFRSSALAIVETIRKIFAGNDQKAITNYKRFQEEYGGDTLYFPKHNPKPEDYERMFSGNTDDNFRIGISFGKSSMKLYTKYYNSDLILASPLGLRMTIGAEGESERDYDFLASLEMLIMDQAEICMAQNWDHVIHFMDHLHLQPQSTEHTDFSRVRAWCLNGWSQFYRQTLLLSSHDLPEFRSIFNNKCANYRGKIRVTSPIKVGSIRHVIVQVPQTFHRIEVNSLEQSFDAKLQHFTTILLPQLRSVTMARCLIFVPSYFDYVRLRNYFKKEELSFVQICEYTKDGKIARARDMFFHGSSHFLLYSERSHFFRRPRIKGIRHIVFYQLPTYPQFYSEMVNLMANDYQNRKDGIDASAMTVTGLYTKYDLLRLSAIVGSEQAAKLAASAKAAHTFSTQK
ncbi:U3 small nucleolar RNA-associated protein 25 homolog [Toxorhynchites rutilus septentrionalis]|uniref:U3 small nucleolar RNA-associated protein 25 homolog n=1 Tax=Toxorhynchites rutilus septentrionalis TaxID=329112 RepID=UPI002478C4DA|nr:U3 small nucleolar RNA-associated protein 25 homolog [Toxorhynchites rutilus septentrionalis]